MADQQKDTSDSSDFIDCSDPGDYKPISGFPFRDYLFRIMKNKTKPDYFVLILSSGGVKQIKPSITAKFLVFAHTESSTLFLYEIASNSVAMCKIAGPPGEERGASLRLADVPDGLLIYSDLGKVAGKETTICYRYDSAENNLVVVDSSSKEKKKKGNKF